MRANIPKGMGGGPQNMNAMIKQAQKMQEDMATLQSDLEQREYTATSGGGAVSVTVDGKHFIKSIKNNSFSIEDFIIRIIASTIFFSSLAIRTTMAFSLSVKSKPFDKRRSNSKLFRVFIF